MQAQTAIYTKDRTLMRARAQAGFMPAIRTAALVLALFAALLDKLRIRHSTLVHVDQWDHGSAGIWR
jgi:hypothetical protein